VGKTLNEDLVATVFPSVLEKVADDLLNPLWIGMHTNAHRERNRPLPAPSTRKEHCRDIVYQLTQVEHLRVEAEAAGLEAGDHQDILDQVAQVLGLLADVSEELVHLGNLQLLP
jgi:hypothetical protein